MPSPVQSVHQHARSATVQVATEPQKDKKLSVLESHGYYLGKTIGTGSYATVRVAQSERHEGTVAIKIVSKFSAPADYLKKFLPREIEVVKGLRHPNLIRFLQAIETTHRVYIVMEYAENGSLLDIIRKDGCIDETRARKWFRQLVDAVDYCHERGVVHRDIKCENMLMDHGWNLKLSDFGFARSNLKGKNGQNILSETYCGSYAYASPEILRGIPYVPQHADVWSMGVVLFAMVYGRLPFDDSNYRELIKQKNLQAVIEIFLSASHNPLLSIPLIAQDVQRTYSLCPIYVRNVPGHKMDINSTSKVHYPLDFHWISMDTLWMYIPTLSPVYIHNQSRKRTFIRQTKLTIKRKIYFKTYTYEQVSNKVIFPRDPKISPSCRSLINKILAPLKSRARVSGIRVDPWFTLEMAGTSRDRADSESSAADDRKLSIPSKDIVPATLVTKPQLQAAAKPRDRTRRSTLEETDIMARDLTVADEDDSGSLGSQQARRSENKSGENKARRQSDNTKGKPLQNIKEEK